MWFKTDDTLHAHPKARRAGVAAMGLWVLAGSWSMSYKTDGFVPDWFVGSFPEGMDLAGRLTAATLWVPATRDGENGWSFHDWEDYQPSSDEIEKGRRNARERQRRHRERIANRGGGAAEQPDDPTPVTRDRTVTQRVTNAPPSRPVPTRPDPIPIESSRDKSPSSAWSANDDEHATAEPLDLLIPPAADAAHTKHAEIPIDTDAVKRRRAPAYPLPAGWAPNETHRQRACDRGVDVDVEAEKFRAHAEANDRRQARWDAAFTQWLLNARPSYGSNGGGRVLTRAQEAKRQVYDVWDQQAARMEAELANQRHAVEQ